MIRSMTGYSRMEVEEGGISLALTIRATNHRFLDVQVRLPFNFEALEPALRALIKEHVARGHLEVSVALSGAATPRIQVDRKLLAAYREACETLRAEFGSTADPDLGGLLRVPGLVVANDGALDPAEFERVRALIEQTVGQGLEQLNAMRRREGETLESDLARRLDRLMALEAAIARLALEAPRLYRLRLESRLRELAASVELDSSRLAQEAAYLASRSDIAEELTRLRSHLGQARQLLTEPGEAGKKLDFLLQEMNREANTLLSKTTDVPEVGLEITRLAIELKTEIEKIREQAQNIE